MLLVLLIKFIHHILIILINTSFPFIIDFNHPIIKEPNPKNPHTSNPNISIHKIAPFHNIGLFDYILKRNNSSTHAMYRIINK